MTGEFTDYTARYGALLEEDKLSFRQTLSALSPGATPSDIDRIARMMAINHLLDLPAVSLSSGQTRRARIAAGLLTKPALLILEDPMAGLDVNSRGQVSDILGRVNEGDIRIVLVLRGKRVEVMPDWITHICDVRQGRAWVGTRQDWEGRYVSSTDSTASNEAAEGEQKPAQGSPVVTLRDISISYGDGARPVS